VTIPQIVNLSDDSRWVLPFGIKSQNSRRLSVMECRFDLFAQNYEAKNQIRFRMDIRSCLRTMWDISSLFVSRHFCQFFPNQWLDADPLHLTPILVRILNGYYNAHYSLLFLWGWIEDRRCLVSTQTISPCSSNCHRRRLGQEQASRFQYRWHHLKGEQIPVQWVSLKLQWFISCLEIDIELSNAMSIGLTTFDDWL
jgi:hypothetical protein